MHAFQHPVFWWSLYIIISSSCFVKCIVLTSNTVVGLASMRSTHKHYQDNPATMPATLVIQTILIWRGMQLLGMPLVRLVIVEHTHQAAQVIGCLLPQLIAMWTICQQRILRVRYLVLFLHQRGPGKGYHQSSTRLFSWMPLKNYSRQLNFRQRIVSAKITGIRCGSGNVLIIF